MKASENYLSLMLSSLYKMVLNFEFVTLWVISKDLSIQMITFEQQFPVVLFMLTKVFISFESVDEILGDHSNKRVLSLITVYKVTLIFESVNEILKCDAESRFSCGFVCLYAV